MHYIEEIQQAEQEAERSIRDAHADAQASLELARSDSEHARTTLEQELRTARAKILQDTERALATSHDTRLAEARRDADTLAQTARTKLNEATAAITRLMFSS